MKFLSIAKFQGWLDKVKKTSLHNKFLISCLVLFIIMFSVSYYTYTSKFIPIEKATVTDVEFYCNDIGFKIAEDIIEYVEDNQIKSVNELYDTKHNKTIIKGLGKKRFNELIRYFR